MKRIVVGKSNPGLLKKAKALFGEDLVKEAYSISSYPSGNLLSKDVEEGRVLNRVTRGEPNTEPDISLDICDGEVVIEFTNGKLVKIETSEWGSISAIEKETINMI
jgi:hypothetical protein